MGVGEDRRRSTETRIQQETRKHSQKAGWHGGGRSGGGTRGRRGRESLQRQQAVRAGRCGCCVGGDACPQAFISSTSAPELCGKGT